MVYKALGQPPVSGNYVRLLGQLYNAENADRWETDQRGPQTNRNKPILLGKCQGDIWWWGNKWDFK